MKGRKLLFSLLFVVVAGAVAVLSISSPQQQKNIPAEKELVKEKGIKGAMSFYHYLKADPVTGDIDPRLYDQAFSYAKTAPTSKALAMNWVEMGPNNVGGRVRAILIDNQDNTHQTMFAGGVSGGLWKSITGGQSWDRIPLDGNIAVSSIAQAPNGDIYVGTGEGLSAPAYTNYNSGMIGAGVYKSTDGVSFTIISSTTNWKEVNRLAVDKDGVVYAATSLGLWMSDDNGASFSKIANGGYDDIRIHPNDTKVFASSGGNVMIGDKTGVSLSSCYNTNIMRTELAIAPSNKNVVYAVLVQSGNLHSIQRSIDAGLTWTQVGTGSLGTPANPGAFPLFGFNSQGWYDISAMVHLTDPDIFYVGGISLWKGVSVSPSLPFNWSQISSTVDEYTSGPNPQYVHADQHALTQVPGNANAFYLGSDGGIFKTSNGGSTFVPMNKNFNVTQFYAVTPHPAGGAAGGTQDNSTPWVDNGMNNDPLEATVLWGGDGGWSAFSPFNHDFVIATSQNGSLGRSKDKGENWQGTFSGSAQDVPAFFNNRMYLEDVQNSSNFVTPLLMWQTTNYANNQDMAIFIADTTYAVGSKAQIRSIYNNKFPFDHTITSALATGDTLIVPDKLQSRFFFGANGGVWMTKQALYWGEVTPEWYKVADVTGTVRSMAISKDGDDLWFTTGSNLYRLSNLLIGQDSTDLDIESSTVITTLTMVKNFSGNVSSISVDPNDNNRVLVTIGGYNTNYSHVWYSDDATAATPTFVSKAGVGTNALDAALPVYASVIPLFHSNTVIIGTEFGCFATENITAANPTWSAANDGIEDPVPVFMLRQQTTSQAWVQHMIYDEGVPVYTAFPGVYNYGVIYAATHGRGFFKTALYSGINEENPQGTKASEKASLKVYPNPVIDQLNIEFELAQNEEVVVSIYDMNGRIVQTYNLAKRLKGINTAQFNVDMLNDGIYIVHMQTPTQQATSKIIVR